MIKGSHRDSNTPMAIVRVRISVGGVWVKGVVPAGSGPIGLEK